MILAALSLLAGAAATPAPTPTPAPAPAIVIYSAVMEGQLVGVLVALPSTGSCTIQPAGDFDPLTADLAVRAVIDPDRYCAAWYRIQSTRAAAIKGGK